MIQWRGSWHVGWFELVPVEFTYSLQKEAKRCHVLPAVETQLSLHKHYVAKEPQKHKQHGNAKKLAANYEPAKVSRLKWCSNTLCAISELLIQ